MQLSLKESKRMMPSEGRNNEGTKESTLARVGGK